MAEHNALVWAGEDHFVLAHHRAAAQRRITHIVAPTRAAEQQRRARGRVEFGAVMHLDDLQVEAKVDPKDIDKLQIGQKTLMRLTAFNQRTTPELNGLVTRVSPDVTTDQRTGQSYYTIRVSMPPEEIKRLGDVKVIPGMPVEAFVQTGDRTMLSYLMKPLSDQFMRSFRER